MTTYTPGQVLTAAELNTSFGGKTDNSAANITGGSITGLTVLSVAGTTDSGSTTTGALTVAGGVGIALSLQVGASATIGGQAFVNSNSNSTSLSTGALVVAGGVAVGLNLNVGANLSVSGNAAVNGQVLAESAADSTSIGTGAVVVSGGVGVAKSLFVGGSANVAGNVAVGGGVTVTGAVTTSEIILSTGGLIQFQDGSQQSTAGAINGELSVPTTGGTVTPTAAQVAANSIFNVNGVLTSNVTLVLPASPKVLTVANNTTNASSTAYTLTVKVTGQTPSTTVAQGKASTLYTDTTGAYATSAASGFQFSGQANDPTGLTYDITYSGKIVYQTASGIASKMPSAASYAAGAGLAIKNVAAATTTLATQGTDTFDDGITSPLTMQPNDCICYVSDGVSVWRAAWYSNHVKPKFTTGITFPDGTVQTTANSTTQPAQQWYTVGTTDTVGSFADGDTAIRTSGFTAPFVKVSKNGLVMVRGQHFTLNADGIHVNFAEPLIATDEVNVETQGVYNPSSSYLPSLPWVTPIAGATFIAYPHVVGFAWLLVRGAFLQAGIDYTEDATGFYLVGFAADGVEQYGIFNMNAVSIANALAAANPIISSGVLQFADGSQQGAAALSNRNYVLDGMFDQWTGSAATSTSGGYSNAAMYRASVGTSGVGTNAIYDLRTAGLNITGNPRIAMKFAQTTASTGTVGASTAPFVAQSIEDVTKFAGKSQTLSCWLWTDSGSITIPALVQRQFFGSGGSPSSAVVIDKTVNWVVNTTPKRFSVRVDWPSISGKAIGTNSYSDFCQIGFWLPPGVTFTVNTTQWQLEDSSATSSSDINGAGGSPTPFEYRGYGPELVRVQRQYQAYPVGAGNGFVPTAATSTTQAFGLLPFPYGAMRATPAASVAGSALGTAGAGGSGTVALLPYTDYLQFTISGLTTTPGYSNLVAAGASGSTIILDSRL